MPRPDNPGVRFPPPFLFVAGLLVGWALDRYVRGLPLGSISRDGADAVGGTLVGAGLVLMAWGMITFRRAKTAIIPMFPATGIVRGGPYRFTRNPMYLGFTVTYIGSSLAMYTAWPLILLPLVIWLLHRFVIVREEAYLSRAFGKEYDTFRSEVRRWL
ncbi:MAG: isoprenylcysteine carboxylmethyltransferase family protein [Gemmatimonadetes bacterium]|nr:isoprenylcysteine carboxylmethyltransferase family protein [Gemmatimonadota bacterium]